MMVLTLGSTRGCSSSRHAVRKGGARSDRFSATRGMAPMRKRDVFRPNGWDGLEERITPSAVGLVPAAQIVRIDAHVPHARGVSHPKVHHPTHPKVHHPTHPKVHHTSLHVTHPGGGPSRGGTNGSGTLGNGSTGESTGGGTILPGTGNGGTIGGGSSGGGSTGGGSTGGGTIGGGIYGGGSYGGGSYGGGSY